MVLFFFYFPMNIARGNPLSSALNDSPDRVTFTYCTLQHLRSKYSSHHMKAKFSNCSIIHSKCFLILYRLAALPPCLKHLSDSHNHNFTFFSVCVFEDSTRRPLVARAELLVLPRRRTKLLPPLC